MPRVMGPPQMPLQFRTAKGSTLTKQESPPRHVPLLAPPSWEGESKATNEVTRPSGREGRLPPKPGVYSECANKCGAKGLNQDATAARSAANKYVPLPREERAISRKPGGSTVNLPPRPEAQKSLPPRRKPADYSGKAAPSSNRGLVPLRAPSVFPTETRKIHVDHLGRMIAPSTFQSKKGK